MTSSGIKRSMPCIDLLSMTKPLINEEVLTSKRPRVTKDRPATAALEEALRAHDFSDVELCFLPSPPPVYIAYSSLRSYATEPDVTRRLAEMTTTA